MHRTHTALLALFLFLFAAPVWGQALFVKPVKVLGDPNYIGTASVPTSYESAGPNVVEGRELHSPEAIALDNSVSPPILYIADTSNNRVLAYQHTTQLTAGSVADLILGQTDRFSTNAQGGSGSTLSTGLRQPSALAVDASGNLYVADTGNNRILRYSKPFTQPAGYLLPNLVIGQKSFAGTTANSGGISASTLSLSGTGLRNGLAFDSAGNLWVSDTGNNRVLRFPASVLGAGLNAPSADIELGQKDFKSGVAATSLTSTTSIAGPSGLAFDPKGRLLVADSLQRVLAFPAGITSNTAAIGILGVEYQHPGQSSVDAVAIGTALGVSAGGGVVLVADTTNNRVLEFGAVDTWPPPTANPLSPTATAVMGQPDFSSSMANQGNGDASASTFNLPIDIAYGSGEFYVADYGNNRILVFPASFSGPSASANRVIGQLDFPYWAPNLIEGREFGTIGNGLWGSAVLDYSATLPHLYVADTLNNRILGFNNFTSMQNGQKADIVIGQPDFFRAQINYPTNSATRPNAQGLNSPTALAVDSAGNLFVADTGNSRVLRFPTPFASTFTGSADLVLGQPNFSSQITDPTSQTMSAPVGLAFSGSGGDATSATGWLAVSDNAHNRVVLFPRPFYSGMNATLLFGEGDFNSTTSGSTLYQLSAPRGIAMDPEDRLLVADTGNARVLVFGPIKQSGTSATASFALTTGLSAPLAVGVAPSSGEFWVADANRGGLLHFPSIDKLPPTYASDAAVPAVSPRSAFVDSYNNLLVADGVNRILYFAPQVSVVNGANYIADRALAPGTIASAFPTVTTNPLAQSTQSNPGTLPLPTALGGAEVLVNGVAAPLLYTSPGQINFVLPIGLATGGTANVQVVQPTTGQIYGGAEIPLAAASPGLFTVTGGQSGPIAALNQDNTINSSTNPLTRGQVLSIFATGQGPLPGAPPDGQAASGPSPTPTNPEVFMGSGTNVVRVPDVNVQYSGLAPGLVGVWQINVLIPSDAPSGNTQITVFMDSVPSIDPSNTSSVVTTVSLK